MWKADGNMGDNPIEGYADLQFWKKNEYNMYLYVGSRFD
jgi:hypothetical protein